MAPEKLIPDKDILQFISQFHLENHYSPSVREIMQGCGFHSVASTIYRMDRLEVQGRLKHTPGKARSYVVVA